jgi:uncharacterized membrane protein YbaN (DUF454 family)
MIQQSTRLADPLETPELSRPMRWLLKALAIASLILAVIGAFLPIMPTVPFVLLAAWAATRSSPRLSHWLENHPRMGPPIREWRHGGVVRRSAKWYATLMMSGGAVFMSFFVRPWWVPLTAIAVMTSVGVWLWLRPEHAPPQRPAGD